MEDASNKQLLSFMWYIVWVAWNPMSPSSVLLGAWLKPWDYRACVQELLFDIIRAPKCRHSDSGVQICQREATSVPLGEKVKVCSECVWLEKQGHTGFGTFCPTSILLVEGDTLSLLSSFQQSYNVEIVFPSSWWAKWLRKLMSSRMLFNWRGENHIFCSFQVIILCSEDWKLLV